MSKKKIVLAGIALLGIFLVSFFASYFYLNIAGNSTTVDFKSIVTSEIDYGEWSKNLLFNTQEQVTDLRSKLPKTYIVQSGSMEPAIKTGSIVMSYPVESYWIGDVVTFSQRPGSRSLVTHRIMNREFPDGLDNPPVYRTSGDANEDFDTGEVRQDRVVGKVFLTIPYLGYVANFAKQPYGFLLLVIVPATIIIYEELKNIFGNLWKGVVSLFLRVLKRRKNKSPEEFAVKRSDLFTDRKIGITKDILAKSSILLPAFGAFLVLTGLATAYFNDKEHSPGNVLMAGTWSSPTPIVTPLPSGVPSPTPIPIATHIVISEVKIDGGTGSANNNDFIELYNPTNSAINLDGHRLVLRTGSSTNDTNIIAFSSAHIIPTHGYFLWAHKSQNNNFADTIFADVSSADTLGASNSIALRQGALDTGTIIDALSWNDSVNSLKEGTHFSPNPGINQSMERKAYTTSTQSTMEGGADSTKGNGFDADDNATDFILRTVSQPQNSGSLSEIP